MSSLDFTKAQIRAADEFFGTYGFSALDIAHSVAAMNAADLDAIREGANGRCADAVGSMFGIWRDDPSKWIASIRLPSMRQSGSLILPFNGRFSL